MLRAIKEMFVAVKEMVLQVGRLSWILLTSAWPLLLLVVTFLGILHKSLADGIEVLKTQFGYLWGVLTGGVQGMREALGPGGWPPELANAVAFFNTILPVTQACAYAGILIATYLTCTLIRVCKSFLPTIS